MRKKFNEKFHASCMRISFWDRLRAALLKAERLSQSQENLTPKDRRELKIIRQAIRDSYKRSEIAERYHSRQLERLRREYLYGG